jgi:hypothetical protein
LRTAIFLLSAAVLAHEVSLLRVLAIASYSHAAPLVVSVALLGFGAAGTVLALWPALKRPTTVAAAAALYAGFAPLSLRAAGAVHFNVLQVGWEPTEWFRLLALQGSFCVPFFFAALAIATALALHARRAGPMYAVNLLGSGVGALAVAPLLAWGAPESVIAGLAVMAAIGALFVSGRPAKVWALLAVLVTVLLGLFTVLLGGRTLPMSPFKDLPAAPDKRVLETRYSPLGRVDLAEVPSLHHAPGLALGSSSRLPRQDGLYVDGHLVAALDRGPSTYLDDTTGALAFLFSSAPRVLLLGVGPDLPRADHVVDPNADLLDLSGARGSVAEPRAWLDETNEHFDLILLHVSRRDPLREAPLLTVEGLARALDRVREDGAVAVSTSLITPPRPGLKLLLTAERVTPHVVAVRSLDRLTLLLRHREATDAEWEAIDAFCRRNGFDVVRPIDRRPAAPYHTTDAPLLEPVGDEYPFDVRPATDARPYFHRFFRWSRLGDVLDHEAVPFVEWGFIVACVAFLQVSLLSVLLLVVPLVVSRAARAPAPLFLALGLAYMLLEMAFLARASSLLASPTLAAACVVGGFLLGSGLGSLVGEACGRPLRRAAAAAALLALPAFFLLGSSPWTVGLLSAVLAFPMGMPFPAALGRLPAASVPWALAVNGCASVAAAAGAPLFSSSFSVAATAVTAAALYALVATFGGRAPGSTT